MAKRSTNVVPLASVRPVAFGQALSERYLSYALSTIMARSLPDVRDGLKPVHRRLMHAMRLLRLDPNSAFKKSARVVGDVIGQYHPHGDQSIYDALVRLAQEFSVRYPLIEGQGNFGNIDGDNPAAMRYTEARLTAVAEALLGGIDENAVDFRPNYDGSTDEPIVLPGGFPNLLANGAAGIAVGMACSIPPHNAGELCDALLHLIKTPNARIDTLVDMVKGPDFPTGGVLVEPRESMVESYKTGRGAFRLRARWIKEELPRGQYRIVITEIPYQVQKGKLIERIAEIINAKKLQILEDVRDESADDVRIVLEPRTGQVPAELLMEQLFKMTDLEIRFPLNLNVLDKDNTPRVMDLREALQAWLDHRREVLIRRSTFRLEAIERRLEILEGYLIAYLNLDKLIKIIREEDEPKPKMIKAFGLTDNQAEAILNMRLRALRRWKSSRSGASTRSCRPSARTSRRCSRTRSCSGAGSPKRFRRPRRSSARRPSSAGAAPRSPTRRSRSSTRSRISSSASRSPSCCRPRAGSAPPRGISTPSRRRSSSTRRATRRSSSCTPSRPTRSWCSAPTAASTRWAATGCRVRAATASRSG